MIEQLNYISQLKSNFYISDVIDIIIIALFIYSLFILLRKTRTYMVFVGLTFAVALYFVAQIFNLYLTFVTLRYFVGVSVIILVVIFQNEIRKYLEFLGFIGTRQFKVGLMAPKSPVLNDIINACIQMAQDKIGALIVIQGKDDIESLTEGGFVLDGVISEDIIESIFDPHSDGHDGAIIIKNNRISKYLVQLPLSTNFKELGKKGTRHAAGLGLSELCDALCIVVSEEKGKISICRDGKIKTLDKLEDIEKLLNKYVMQIYSPEPEKGLKNLLRYNFWLKLGALLLSVVIWFFTAYQTGIIQQTYSVPIILKNIPDNTLVEEYSPKDVKLTFSGRGDSVFKNLQNNNFEITLDVSKLDNGINKKAITGKNIKYPANLTLLDIEPETILLTVKKYYTVQVPVNAQVSGTIQEGLEIKEIVVTPDIVDVLVPVDTGPPETIFTDVIDVTNKSASFIVPAEILVPEGMVLISADTGVNVAFTISE